MTRRESSKSKASRLKGWRVRYQIGVSGFDKLTPMKSPTVGIKELAQDTAKILRAAATVAGCFITDVVVVRVYRKKK